MRRAYWTTIGALCILTASLTWAQPEPKAKLVTFDKLIELLELEVPEAKLLKMIEESPSTFTLSDEQVQKLKQAGASKRVLEALQKPAAKLADSSDVSNFVIILDCSGSMKDQIAGAKTKFEAAQAAAANLLKAIPDGRNVSLVVYGHDANRECGAVEVLFPMNALDASARNELDAMLSKLGPEGHTPIASALKAAGGQLVSTQGLSKVILITDGMESCHGDPEAEAKELLRKFPQLKGGGVNVIGFALTDKERTKVGEIATAGEGKFYAPKDAKELVTTVRKIETTLAKATEPEAEAEKPAAKSDELKKFVFKGHTNHIVGMAYSPDGTFVATGSADKTIRLWSLETGDRIDRWSNPSGVICLDISPDGKLLAAGDEDNTLSIWDVKTGEVLIRIKDVAEGVASFGRWNGPALVKFSVDGKSVATVGNQNNKTMLWDVETGKKLRHFGDHQASIKAIAFSPDGKLFASAAKDAIRLWDANTGKPLDELRGHDGKVWSICFSPDSSRLLSTGDDKTAIVWNVAKGNQERPVMEGHTQRVYHGVFLTDGRILTLAGQGIRLWDAQHKKAVILTPDGNPPTAGFDRWDNPNDGSHVRWGFHPMGWFMQHDEQFNLHVTRVVVVGNTAE